MEKFGETSSEFEAEAPFKCGSTANSTKIFDAEGGGPGAGGALALQTECVTSLRNEVALSDSMEHLNVGQSSEALAFHTGVQGGVEVYGSVPNEKQDKAWLCAICRDKIKQEETAQIKGCEHSYCVTCILRWASYKTEPWCPQCRLPFSFLYVYRALDGSLSDYMFEESVCLLLRAFWFKPLQIQEFDEQDDVQDDYDVFEEYYYTSHVRLGNRRWGDSGYVRGGRREARPVGIRHVPAVVSESSSGGSSSRQAKGKEPVKEATGRRAKRAQKRELFDNMVGKQHQAEGKSISFQANIKRVN